MAPRFGNEKLGRSLHISLTQIVVENFGINSTKIYKTPKKISTQLFTRTQKSP
jgi:hypothetical protein